MSRDSDEKIVIDNIPLLYKHIGRVTSAKILFSDRYDVEPMRGFKVVKEEQIERKFRFSDIIAEQYDYALMEILGKPETYKYDIENIGNIIKQLSDAVSDELPTTLYNKLVGSMERSRRRYLNDESIKYRLYRGYFLVTATLQEHGIYENDNDMIKRINAALEAYHAENAVESLCQTSFAEYVSSMSDKDLKSLRDNPAFEKFIDRRILKKILKRNGRTI